MTESELHRATTWAVIALAVPTWIALQWVSAPYGRHARGGWGPSISAKLGWIVMESPASLVWFAIYAMGSHALEPAPLAMLALWQLHYVHRAFVQPLRQRDDGRTMPASVALLAIAFNLVNAYVNARQVSEHGGYGVAWLTDPRFLVGVAVFLAGRTINTRADAALVALRNEGKGYQIPRGPLFDRISCPNYAGEILEWIGWAVATWSLAGLSFAIYTFANLAPRAGTHHRWYKERFAEYPPERRALVPGVW